MKEETYAGTPESAKTIGITPEHAMTYTVNSDRELTPREQALARIEELEKSLLILTLKDFEGSWTPENHAGVREHNENVAKLSSTLKAVLELHKPLNRNAWQGTDHEAVMYQICAVCVDGDGNCVDFPCPTADLITKGVLGE